MLKSSQHGKGWLGKGERWKRKYTRTSVQAVFQRYLFLKIRDGPQGGSIEWSMDSELLFHAVRTIFQPSSSGRASSALIDKFFPSISVVH